MWYMLRGMSRGQYLLLLILRSAAGCGRQFFFFYTALVQVESQDTVRLKLPQGLTLTYNA